MKAKLKVSDILKGVKLCAEATDQKDDIRANIRFLAENGRLYLQATNTQYSIEVVCDGDIEEDGEAIVDGKYVYSILQKASGECTLSADGKRMTVKASGRTKLDILTHDIPMIKPVKGAKISFDSVAFRNAIGKVAYAISEDQSRQILTGAHIVSDGNTLTITSLDGFRLAQTAIPCTGDAIDIIVPTKILLAICSAITSGDLELISNSQRITVNGESFSINAVTLIGDYIDTTKILPTSFKSSALLKTADIRNCAETAVIASGVSKMVKLNIEKDNIAISSESQGIDFNGDINALVDGDELAISFNMKYLMQAISHIDTEQCELKFNSPIAPVVIVPHVDGNTDLHLVLPVRTFS